MSATLTLRGLIEKRGASRVVEGHITSCAASRDHQRFAFTTGEGDVIVAHRSDLTDAASWNTYAVHDGPALSVAPDTDPHGFLTGGDDGRLCRLDMHGEIEELGKSRRWVEHVLSYVDGKASYIAAAMGKQVELRDATGRTVLKTFEHPSSVSGITFDAKGKRLAASHYNGASLWYTQSKSNNPRLLEWKGSHIGVAMHPQGEALVTAMQDNDLHGWRLSDGHNIRMSGYPTKVRSLSFSANGKWLATSGADVVVMWPFFGGGPMGKPPMELPGAGGALCTRVAFHPEQEVVAAGFADGTVLMIEPATERVLPVSLGGNGPISALAYSADGCMLGFGTEEGLIGLVDLAAA
ncbi:WD40 repeat domain-containing protein [Acetobacter senegalensis]|uniref:WD40 repeat domain-containing protein n=1 Tax=Acetobacter senegalensis TaxID=446692 RepID=UPI00128E7A22|nr:WD40 repeat domain-containing protein [Acetobacter senegalensis]MCG4256249.1 WD40 repeat domain-containing protein [Acetobacter senegalensis]MCG4266193.1 WD40 repeat domain-containing protein [Acetobacter senegalensis]MPQ72700.1 WD40 repeat domain-containing protein [Acetobacter senegalensis]